MAYTQAIGRQFWLDFDNHFKFESGQNGLWDRYTALGGYDGPSRAWKGARQSGDFPDAFVSYADSHKDNIEFIANEQQTFFTNALTGGTGDIVRAFQDFAFGVLASPGAPNRGAEPVHTMNGGIFARDYLSWHGFIEAAMAVHVNDAFWQEMRWINGMAWELQAKARPQEFFPNQNQPLADIVTNTITERWKARTAEQIAVEFDNYDDRPFQWAQADAVA